MVKMNKEISIARVFPRKTSMSPTDTHAYFGEPDMFTPFYDKVYVSVCFTWDKDRGYELSEAWKTHSDKIDIDGPAFGNRGDEFITGMFLKPSVTITSRGCPNNCPWCFVPEREGHLKELPITEGNIIQDNNLLACSRDHIDKVFNMLSKQKKVDFAGGLESDRITDDIVEKLRGLSIYQIWLAHDRLYPDKSLFKAVKKLRKYFSRNQIRCYVLIGQKGDTLPMAEYRLKQVYNMGTLPFAMRYRTPSPDWKGSFGKTEREWGLLAREWTRPAIMKSIMKNSKATWL